MPPVLQLHLWGFEFAIDPEEAVVGLRQALVAKGHGLRWNPLVDLGSVAGEVAQLQVIDRGN